MCYYHCLNPSVNYVNSWKLFPKTNLLFVFALVECYFCLQTSFQTMFSVTVFLTFPELVINNLIFNAIPNSTIFLVLPFNSNFCTWSIYLMGNTYIKNYFNQGCYNCKLNNLCLIFENYKKTLCTNIISIQFIFI